MRILLCLVVYASVFALKTEAHDGEHPPKKVAPSEHYRPTAMPCRIILTWSGDPSTTQSVTWRTDTTVARAFAEVIEADSGPIDAKKACRVIASTSPFESSLFKTHAHSATFIDLKPATRYAYRVGDDVNWSEWLQFSTASAEPQPFSFIYFGDAQNDLRSMWSRVIRESQRDQPKSAFFLHAGDLINNADDDAQWGEWFEAGGFLNGMIPSLPTPGNHEYASEKSKDGKIVKRWLSKNWNLQFTLPQNGPEGFAETCYYIDYQGVRFVSLNSNEGPLRQVEWLDSVLRSNTNRWTICTFHHPIYSTAKDRDNPEIRAAWKPIFDQYRVDLVLTGHDHTYGRTGLEVPRNVSTGLNTQSKESGTVYVVSVSGPKMYALDEKNRSEFRRVAEDTQLYQLVTVDNDEIRFEAKTAKGELYDAFTLKKRPGAINELIERRPETSERLRPKKTLEVKLQESK